MNRPANMLILLLFNLLVCSYTASAALPRFVDLRDGTTLDTVDNVRWLKNANCFGRKNLKSAQVSTENLSSGRCGLNDGSAAGDWRLPNLAELRNLVDSGFRSESLELAGFNNVQAYGYWSSSPDAWSVSMYSGDSTNSSKDSSNFMWPVRTGNSWKLDSLVIRGGFNFGHHNLGAAGSSRIALVTNTGVAPKAITSITLNDGNAEMFTVAPGGPLPCKSTVPMLAAGESCTLLLEFTPGSTGNKSTHLKLSMDNQTLEIPVSGTGIITIGGKLYSLSTGGPLSGATVALGGGTTTTTDSFGTFTLITPPTEGTYALTFSSTGQGMLTKSGVNLSGETGTDLTIGMTYTGNLAMPTQILNPAEAGKLYTGLVKITGGTGPFTFSKAYGSLPNGMHLNADIGSISGVPEVPGTFTFALGVNDSLGAYAERELALTVSRPLAITTALPLPRGTRLSPYKANIQASGGVPPYTIILETPSTFAELSSIYGIPAISGAFPFTVKVDDFAGRSTTKGFTLYVDEPLTLVTTNLNNATTRIPFRQNLVVEGGVAPYTWKIATGSLPPGLKLERDGVISGTPTMTGGYLAIISVKDAINRTATRMFPLTVNSGVEIGAIPPLLEPLTSPPSPYLPGAFIGAPYYEIIRTSGPKSSLTFSQSGLPPSLTLNENTGVISGTIPPGSSAGVDNVSITVSDSSSPPQSQRRNFCLRSSSTLVTITTPGNLPGLSTDAEITALTLKASGGKAPYTWKIVEGTLPPGLALDPLTGIISGTPQKTGEYTVNIRVSDAHGNATGSRTNPDKLFFLRITAPLEIATKELPDGGIAVPYCYTLETNSTQRGFTWTLATGSRLPDGMSLSPSGILSGAPTTAGIFNITIVATSSDLPPRTVQRTFPLNVVNQLGIVERTIPGGFRNQEYSTTVRTLYGTPPFSWKLLDGSTLPPGIIFNPHDSFVTLDGIPRSPGNFTLNLAVTDSATPPVTIVRPFVFNIDKGVGDSTDSVTNVTP